LVVVVDVVFASLKTMTTQSEERDEGGKGKRST
jgi:hypothetical protein